MTLGEGSQWPLTLLSALALTRKSPARARWLPWGFWNLPSLLPLVLDWPSPRSGAGCGWTRRLPAETRPRPQQESPLRTLGVRPAALIQPEETGP